MVIVVLPCPNDHIGIEGSPFYTQPAEIRDLYVADGLTACGVQIAVCGSRKGTAVTNYRLLIEQTWIFIKGLNNISFLKC